MTQDQLKQAVARAALDYVLPKLTNSDIVGIGTGSTANYFIDYLAQHKDRFSACVASSSASETRLTEHGIRVCELNDVEQMRFYIDGADEANAQLQLIKGGGAALTREKIVAACAEEFICIADGSKWVDTLGRFPLPVEVIPMARAHVSRELAKFGGLVKHRAEVITDNGGEILDVHELKISDAIALESQINQIVGVISNGLFAARPADVLLLSTEDGVKTLRAEA